MSRTIDQRVVEMKFDNKQFETAVNQSRTSIRNLEQDINMLDGIKALNNLNKAISGVNFAHMSKSIDNIKGAFSTLGTVGRSIINKLTTDAMNKFTESCRKAKSAVENVFKTIYQKGYNRASNLESSSFQIEGFLKRTLTDVNEIEDASQKLGKIIQDSVSDTAFGLDEASLAASTLAATFGVSEEGLNKINTALRATAGIAGSTGAEYQTVADIMASAAAKGVAMGDEFQRLAAFGLSGEEEVAKYANRHLDIQKQLNKELKKSGKITAADIKELESKRKITAEIFMSTFDDRADGGRYSFFNQAKEANETLTGVLANIGAAQGRLGALFIQPLIKNSGPLVKFLQVVKDGISAFAHALDELEIPKMVTDFFTDVIIDGTKHLKTFIDEFKKGTTPLNDFLTKVKDVIDKLTLIFDLTKENVDDLEKHGSWGKLYDSYLPEEMEVQNKKLKKETKNIGKNFKDWKSYYDKYQKLFKDSNALTEDQKRANASSKYIEQINDGNPKTLEQWKDLFLLQEEIATRKKFPALIDPDTDELIDTAFNSIEKLADKKAYEAYTKQMSDMTTASREAAIEAAKLHATETEVFGHDYIKDFLDGITNIGSAIADIFSTIGEAIGLADGPLKDFFGLFTSESDDEDITKARRSLNAFSEGFKNATENFKDFVNSDEGKAIIKTIGSYLKTIAKVIGGVFTVIGKVISVAAPLISKVFGIIGKVLGSFVQETEGLDTVDIIINGICSAIEWLGEVLDGALDIISSVVDYLKENGVLDFLGKIMSKIGDFGSYIYKHWPEIWDTVTGKLKEFKNWLSEKIQPVIETIKPYFDDLVEKIKDLTDGFIDLKNPLDTVKRIFGIGSGDSDTVAGAMENTDTALGKVKETVDGVKDSIEGFASMDVGGVGGKLLGRAGFAMQMGDIPFATDEDLKELKDGQENVEEAEEITTDIFGRLKKINDEKEKSESKDKKQYKNKNGKLTQIDGIKGVINVIKEKFAELDFGKIKDAFGNFLKLFGFFAAVFIAGKGVAAVRDGMTGFNNFALAVNGGYDVNTMRKKEIVKILLSLAALVAVVAVAVGLCVQSVIALSQIPAAQLWKGIAAFVVITAAIAGLLMVIMFLARGLKGDWETKGWAQTGLKLFNIPFDREKYDSKHMKESAFKPLLAIAAILAIFTASVMLISTEIQKLGAMPEDKLARGTSTFIVIAAAVIILAAVILSFATRLSDNRTIRAAFKGQGKNRVTVTSVLDSIAALIASMGASILLIAVAMSIISKIPEDQFKKSAIVLGVIGGALLILVAGVLAAAFGIMKAANGKDSAIVAKQMLYIMGGTAVILMAFAQAVDIIALAVAGLALTSKVADLNKPIVILSTIMGILILLVAVVLGGCFLIMKVGHKHMNKLDIGGLATMFGGIATILIVFAVAVNMISAAIIAMSITFNNINKSVMENVMGTMAIIMGFITLFVGVILVGIFALKQTNALTPTTTGFLLSIAAILVVFGGVVVAIAYAAKLLKGVGLQELIFVGIAMGAIMLIIGGLIFFATFASKAPTISKGVSLAVKIVIAVGALFVMIGAAAYLIGKGVDKFGSGIDKFQKAINKFSKMEDKTIKKGARNIGFSIKEMLEGVVDAIIEFGNSIGGKKDKLSEAIIKILDVIQNAISSFWITLETNILERLTIMIDKLSTFLQENKEKIIQIGQDLEDIIWWGVIEPFLTDFATWLWEKMKWVADYLIDKRQPIIDKVLEFGTKFIGGIAEGIDKHKKEISDSIWKLLKAIANLLFNFLGLDAPFPNLDESAGEFEKNVKDVGEQVDNQFVAGVSAGESKALRAVRGFVSNIGKTMWDEVKNNSYIKAVGEYLGNHIYDLFHPFESDEWKTLSGEKQKEWTSKTAAYIADLIKSGVPEKEAYERGAKYAQSLVDGWTQHIEGKEGFNMHSPSKLTEKEAENVTAGFQLGIKKGTYGVVSEAYKMANHVNSAYDAALFNNTIVNSAKKGVQTTGDLLKDLKNNFINALPKITKVIEDSGLFDTNKFIIKPGMDLSNITKDSKQLQKIFDSVGLSNVNAGEAIGLFDNLKKGNFNKIDVSSLANGFDSANDKNGSKSSSDSNASLGSINFTQNNYSPKSLSQIDIYRQTENLLGKQSTLNSLASSVGLTGTNF
ncbi:MAG: hypothetical protein IKF29_00650 [Oceanobacillus sp.]|nr:hypothetical protein [Oceanobacillus sp.]